MPRGPKLRTACADYTVGDLLDHIGGAALAFRAAAVKEPLDGGPSGDAANLADDWRARIPRDLLALAEAWRDPDAWTGTTAAGGVELPGEVAGVVALDELVLHGWDLARALDRPAGYDGPGLEAVHATVQQFRSSGIEGLFSGGHGSRCRHTPRPDPRARRTRSRVEITGSTERSLTSPPTTSPAGPSACGRIRAMVDAAGP